MGAADLAGRTTGSERTAADAVLRVVDLECERGERALFAPTSFVVGAGQVVWIRGANGQGKTTLLRTLAGLAAPSGGAIVWGGAPDVPPRPLYLAHANALKDDLKVGEALRFLLDLGPAPVSAADADAALALFAMAGRRDALVRTLSQGQRRRVALARLAAQREPRPWLLDEPFDALDSGGVRVLAELIAGHARRGAGIVLTSHLPVPIPGPAPIVVELHEPSLA